MSFTMIQECIDSLKEVKEEDIEAIAQRLIMASSRGNQVLLMGNGGSASTASHIANDLHAAGIKATSLCDNTALLTRIANDKSYDDVFIEQLVVRLNPEDIVIAISGSGNSENVVRAINFANGFKAMTIGLLGFGGGRLKDMVKTNITLKSKNYGIVESVHFLILHAVADTVKKRRHGAKAVEAAVK